MRAVGGAGDDDLDAAQRALYRLAPEQFLAARDERATASGDLDLARSVRALRKPTLAAWIVNAHVAAHPDVVEELTGVHEELLAAHEQADAAALRTATARRRELVARVAAAAVDSCGRAVSQTVREDVTSTIDAAVADPGIAARLGTLQRPQRWSGFGVAASAAPALHVVDEPDAEPEPVEADDHSEDEGDRRLADAERALSAAQEEEDEAAGRVRRLTTRLTTLQHDLAQARRRHVDAKAHTAAARAEHRAARSAADRAAAPRPRSR